jgi:ParB-like chromosome segregation protein Spo0J
MKPKAYADEIPVYCAHDKIMPLADLKLNPRNPNHHSEEQIKLGAKIILGNGWRAPITISNLSGMVTRGHGRILFAQDAGLTSGPIDYQDYENEAAEWADLLADNRLSELSEIDLSEVKDILDEIVGIDVDLTGYSIDELLADIERDNPAPPDVEFKEYDESTANDVEFITCPECGHKFPK